MEVKSEVKPVEYDLLYRIRRIHKLSERPHNPGYAYRHLEHINAICDMILKEYPAGVPVVQSIPQPTLAPVKPLEMKPPTPGAASPYRM